MDKAYNPKEVEITIYENWEKKGYFKPEINPKGKPYCIILPPPNANAPLHFGHAMYVIEDILVRFHRMKGEAAFWIPGADHAGFETQFVFEKKLQERNKSRFDFNRETLYKMIWDYVQEQKIRTENQLRRLGFSLDWTRSKFTLDKDIVKIVYKTFKRMYDDSLIYRGDRLVNYCTRCGTSFSDLEVNHKEQKDPLYYIKYGPLVVATVRPETMFGDTAIAVNPNDKRYKKYIGKEIELETLLGKKKLKVIADEVIDPKFGTGVMKVTPAHDMRDFEIGEHHNIERIRTIDLDGKLNERAGKYKGLYPREARKLVAEDLQSMGLMERVDENYIHTIEVCYKCQTTIEPMLLPQWFIKMDDLAKPAIEAVKKGKIKIFPKKFEKLYFQFLENIKDWNISRQIVWGIRIPAWQCRDCKEWIVTEGEAPKECSKCKSKQLMQDEDPFDTWFSSSQWPFAALRASQPGDFETFYPTSVMETGYDILRWWVARMVIMGIYATGKIPFEDVVLHGLVNDPLGKKMSKSKGNVVNPLELVDQYGGDAVRFALVYGTALGNDQSLSYPKLEAAKKFANKLWNMARFIDMKRIENYESRSMNYEDLSKLAKNENDKMMIGKTQSLVKEVTKHLNNYKFNYAAEALYEFAWHEFADKYIENVKTQNSNVKSLDQNSFIILNSLFLILLELLHPFMPFITEAIYLKMPNHKESIMIEKWPQIK